MNIESERQIIIEKLNEVNEEWLLKAIKRLLEIDEVEEEHKKIIDERLSDYSRNPEDLLEWDDVKNEL